MDFSHFLTAFVAVAVASIPAYLVYRGKVGELLAQREKTGAEKDTNNRQIAQESLEELHEEARRMRVEMRQMIDTQSSRIRAIELENQDLRARVALLEGERDHAADGLTNCLKELREARDGAEVWRAEAESLNKVVSAVLTLLDIKKDGREAVEGGGAAAERVLDAFLSRANHPLNTVRKESAV